MIQARGGKAKRTIAELAPENAGGKKRSIDANKRRKGNITNAQKGNARLDLYTGFKR